jgi:hypothetical protein
MRSPELACSRPCAACHGPGGYKIGAPALAGQYAAFIERKLAGFAQGIRHNVIYEQTRDCQATGTRRDESGRSVLWFAGSGAGGKQSVRWHIVRAGSGNQSEQ